MKIEEAANDPDLDAILEQLDLSEDEEKEANIEIWADEDTREFGLQREAYVTWRSRGWQLEKENDVWTVVGWDSVLYIPNDGTPAHFEDPRP
jgi:hypothetical protein